MATIKPDQSAIPKSIASTLNEPSLDGKIELPSSSNTSNSHQDLIHNDNDNENDNVSDNVSDSDTPSSSSSHNDTGNHNHPIVGDRVIEGEGTSQEAWRNWEGLHNLPLLNIAENFAPHHRVCVFSPHPDDEVLGCGGLLQQLAANGNTILLVHVTNGTQSHPDSKVYPPEKLDVIRPKESLEAIQVMGIADKVKTISLDLPDGDVFGQQVQFRNKIAAFINSDDILVTPFVHDGHPDHEATGQVIAEYAKQQKLACYQVLIWAWHWAKPADSRIPWNSAVRVDLTPEQSQQKARAITCFKSQITVDESTGNPPILSAQTIARISQPWEVYLYESNL